MGRRRNRPGEGLAIDVALILHAQFDRKQGVAKIANLGPGPYRSLVRCRIESGDADQPLESKQYAVGPTQRAEGMAGAGDPDGPALVSGLVHELGNGGL